MLKKFLKDAVILTAGKPAEDIVDLLDTSGYVNEFIIAKKLNLTINQVRNILYKISGQGLVSSVRKKDKRKGWYTYFWRIEILKSLEFVRDTLIKKIEQMNNQIKSRETKRFYSCERCNLELNEENALLYDFTCNECGAIFTLKDNTKLIREMKRNIDKLSKDLAFVEEELTKERSKIDKKKLRGLKKEEKIKKEKSFKKKELNKKEKAKRMSKKETSLKKNKTLKKNVSLKKTSKTKPVSKAKIKPVKKVQNKKKIPANIKKISKKEKVGVKKVQNKKKSTRNQTKS
ncbi:hypothetical protein K0A97_00090 [Patescibacteria group bacterium]|nr:hypothetical protein [Patescibacteria group bacterium]